jgi:hypothetical protein
MIRRFLNHSIPPSSGEGDSDIAEELLLATDDLPLCGQVKHLEETPDPLILIPSIEQAEETDHPSPGEEFLDLTKQ